MGVGVSQAGVALSDEERVGEVAVADGLHDVGLAGREAVVQFEAYGFAKFPCGTQ